MGEPKTAKTSVYSFYRSNELLRVDNGVMVQGGNKEVLQGGTIEYLGEPIQNIYQYTMTFYFLNGGEKQSILSNATSLEGEIEGFNFPDDLADSLGQVSSEKLFYQDDLVLEENLYFDLGIVHTNGDTQTFTLKLEVESVN